MATALTGIGAGAIVFVLALVILHLIKELKASLASYRQEVELVLQLQRERDSFKRSLTDTVELLQVRDRELEREVQARKLAEERRATFLVELVQKANVPTIVAQINTELEALRKLR